jgi:anaerobic carbon-monoxide dehydrogenase iron sulfur subunit
MKILALHPEKCTGCLRCELACSYMQTGQFQPSKSVIRVSPFEGYTSYAPYTCTQCAEGWCMTACPVGAIQINAAGAKDVLDDTCVGCKLCGGAPACASACPTQAITFEEAETADWIGDFAAERAGRVLALEAR